MQKMNNKGFLLAESLVVSTFVLTVLVLLFVQFKSLFNSYEDSYDYNTVEGIYNLNTIKKYILNNENKNDSLANQIGGSGYVTIVKEGTCQAVKGLTGLNYCSKLADKMNLKTLIYTSSNISSLNTSDSIFTNSFKDFLDRIENQNGRVRLIGQFNDGTYATIVFKADDNNSPYTSIICSDDNTVTSGDGLYKDNYNNGRCVYKGKDPNNYITFNNELWRIISKEADGSYKIVRNDVLKKNGENPVSKWNNVANNTWGDSVLHRYLNTTYYQDVLKENNQIIEHDWYAGAVESKNPDLQAQIAAEKSVTTNDLVGLVSASDYLLANSNGNCSTFKYNNENASTCAKTNWLNLSNTNWWTLSPSTHQDNQAYYIKTSGSILWYSVNNGAYDIRPVVFLNPGIILTGSGTKDDPYNIN